MPFAGLRGALCAVAFTCLPVAASAAAPCEALRTGADVVRCALESNAEVIRQRQEAEAIGARRLVAGPVLPSLPVLSVQGGGRWAAPQKAINAYATLAQEFEIGGQRKGRLDEVDAQVAAQIRKVGVTENEIAAEAMRAYVALVAAKEGRQLADRMRDIGDELATFARGRSQQSLLSEVDAHLLLAEAVQLQRLVPAADRQLSSAAVDLQLVLGLPTAVQVEGEELPVLPLGDSTLDALVSRALLTRGDIGAAEEEARVVDAERARLERERLPNLTTSLNVGNDGFGELIAGVGLSFPLPVIPGGAGASKDGLIAVTRVRRQQADANLEAVRRRVTAEVTRSFHDYQSRRSEVALFEPATLTAARTDLQLLRKRVLTGDISVRDALLSQRSLIEFLRSFVESRIALAVASIELTRAAALPWFGEHRE